MLSLKELIRSAKKKKKKETHVENLGLDIIWGKEKANTPVGQFC